MRAAEISRNTAGDGEGGDDVLLASAEVRPGHRGSVLSPLTTFPCTAVPPTRHVEPAHFLFLLLNRWYSSENYQSAGSTSIAEPLSHRHLLACLLLLE